MKPRPIDQVEQGRITHGPKSSTAAQGNNGAFHIMGPERKLLLVIASDGGGWEHVSVSTKSRVPTWTEMCFVKDLFWFDDECVVQYHPPRAQYVNVHPHVLHLWRARSATMPMPPIGMV